MKLIENIKETKAPDAIVEPNATETTIPVVLCINKETNHEYLSSGDLVIIESTNSNKLERYVTLGKLTNVTTVSPNEEDDRHTFNQARVMVDIEDMEMGTAGKEKTARLAISRSIEDCAPSEQQAAGVFTMIKLLHKQGVCHLGFGNFQWL